MRISDWSSDVCSSDLPILVEGQGADIGAVAPEGVEIAIPRLAPADEIEPELEGRAGAADEVVLVDPEQLVEVEQRRNRRLADADGADRRRFDYGNAHVLIGERAPDRRRRHPAGGAAAHDHDVPYRPPAHRHSPAIACSAPRRPRQFSYMLCFFVDDEKVT